MSEAVNYDSNAERSVLAACLMNKDARQMARKRLSGSDFYDQAHEQIWDALGQDGVDPALVMTRLIEARARRAIDMMPDLVTWPTIPAFIDSHAKTVKDWANRRNIDAEAIRLRQQVYNTERDADVMMTHATTHFKALHEATHAEDVKAFSIPEINAATTATPDWLIPGLLERRDRLMLTGVEGLGKSFLLRQFAILAAAGLHPFTSETITPIKTLVLDYENTLNQIRRSIEPVCTYGIRYGNGDAMNTNAQFHPSERIDITTPKAASRIYQLLDRYEPDLVVIGPLYRLVPRALQTDDEAAPVLAALDSIRDRGISLLIEAHAGHVLGKTGVRDLRPRGSSALLGWPEFGYGMRDTDTGGATLTAWRGDRASRDWPHRLRPSTDGDRWLIDDRPEDDPIKV